MKGFTRRLSRSNLRRSAVIAAAFGLTAISSMAGLPGTSDEPTYDGQPLSYWVRDVELFSSHMPAPLQDEAKTAVAHIGTSALPFLLRWMQQDLHSGFIQDGIIQAFVILGPAARSAIPELGQMATNPPESVSHLPDAGPHSVTIEGYAPLLALGAIGPDALPTLSNMLTNSRSVGLHLGAILAIRSMGSNGLPALPALIRYMDDTNELVAFNAIEAVGAVGAHQQMALAALVTIIHGTRSHLRNNALLALSNFGEEAAPVLLSALKETGPGTYNIAFTTLVTIAPHALTNKAVLAIAADGLASADIDRRTWAAQVLRAAGQQASGEKPDIMVPGGQWDKVFQDATNALRQLAPELLRPR